MDTDSEVNVYRPLVALLLNAGSFVIGPRGHQTGVTGLLAIRR
jgi:hypothetical protein